MDAYHFFADLSRLERELGLPERFLAALIEEEDWSFVIKSHAVIEAALTHLITSIADPRLKGSFVRLPLDGRFSKIDVIKALGQIDPPTLELVKRFARMRNQFVHGTKYLAVKLETFIAGVDPTDRIAVSKLIARVVTGSDEEGFVTIADKGLLAEPKLTLAVGVSAILARTLFKIHPEEYALAREKAQSANPAVLLLGILLLAVLAATKPGGPTLAA